jgi:hypothetical protein
MGTNGLFALATDFLMRNPPMFCAHVALCYLKWVDKISTRGYTRKIKEPYNTVRLEPVLGGYITVFGGYHNFLTLAGSSFPKITYKRVQFSLLNLFAEAGYQFIYFKN